MNFYSKESDFPSISFPQRLNDQNHQFYHDGLNSNSYQKLPWKRILYEKQIYYKDNYYDPKTIFSQLKIVKARTPYSEDNEKGSKSILQRFKLWLKSYGEYVFQSTIVMQQFSAICFFLCIHKYLLRKSISLFEVVGLNFIFIVAGISFYYYFESPQKLAKFSLISFLETFLLFIICLEMTSPIIKTLTVSISDDTIEALTIFLATVHLVFHDYQQTHDERPRITTHGNKNPTTQSFQSSSNIQQKNSSPLHHSDPSHAITIGDDEKENEISSKVISLNTAIFTAILLASRLDNNNVVVAYIILAIISFSLFPLMISLIKARSKFLFLWFAFVQWILTSQLIYNLDGTLFIAYEILVLLLWFLGPLLYLYMLSYKKAYHGPWNIPQIH